MKIYRCLLTHLLPLKFWSFSALLLVVFICFNGFLFGQNVGINEPNPTHTLHIKPLNPGDEPIRIEGVQAAVGGENGVLIHNTADGIVRFITIGQMQDQIDTHLDSLSFDISTNILSAWVNGVNHDVLIPSGTGPQGPAGEDGQDGNDGLSAYDIWLNEGNVGSEADFIASLQGDPGLQGPQGDPGPVGPQGPAGTGGIDWTQTIWVNNNNYTLQAGDEIIHFYNLSQNRNLILGTCNATTNANRQVIAVNHGARTASTSVGPGTHAISLTTSNTARFPGLNSWGPASSGDYNVKTFVCMPVAGTWYWTWR